MYRTAGLIDATVAEAGGHGGSAIAAALEEFAVEASIAKVMGSEVLEYVLDENVQIHGGNGFVKDYPAERYYRDARVNRIFEGTNEINRMLIPGMLMKRAMKGQLGLIPAAKALMDEVMNPVPPSFDEDETVLAAELKLAANAKKIALMVLGTAAQKYKLSLQDQQEVLLNAADIIIDAYQMETAILRAQKLAEKGAKEGAARQIDMAQVFCNDAIQRIEMKAKNTIAAMSEGDELRTMLAALKRFTKNNFPVNTIAARQRIADTLITANKYTF
jgi:alkylation response protein AidB-like acyl-CoA dehydrogenase